MSLPKDLDFLMPLNVESFFNCKWRPLKDVPYIEHDFPGNYLLAWTEQEMGGTIVKSEDVFYVGMSNDRGGVKNRLRAFVNSINGRSGHSGGVRFFTEYCKRVPFNTINHPKRFYFVEQMLECIVLKQKRTPKDLLIMGRVCLLEMELLGYIKYVTGKEPELNKK
jgi:hypothetical protein